MPKKLTDIQRYCIVTLPRTGSSYLGTWIGSHKNVAYHSETFHRRKIFSTFHRNSPLNRLYVNPLVVFRNLAPFAFIENLLARSLQVNPDMTAFGFKLFVYHNDRVFRKIIADSRYSIIFLHRNNKLAMYGSYKLARRTKGWNKLNEKSDTIKQVEFDATEFDQFCQKMEGYEAYARKLLANRPHMDLEYNDINLRQPDVLRHICQGEEAGGVEKNAIRLDKQHDGSDLDRYSNPDAVLRHIKHTSYANAAELSN